MTEPNVDGNRKKTLALSEVTSYLFHLFLQVKNSPQVLPSSTPHPNMQDLVLANPQTPRQRLRRKQPPTDPPPPIPRTHTYSSCDVMSSGEEYVF